MLIKPFHFLSFSIFSLVLAQDPTPAAVYDGDYNETTSEILLRIGNGGAGQSGLVKGSYASLPPYSQNNR